MSDVRDRVLTPQLPTAPATAVDVHRRVSRLRRALDATGHQALGTVSVPRLGATWYLSPPSPRLRVSCAASDAMLAYAFGSGPRPRVPSAEPHATVLVCHPADDDELSACYETVRLVRAWSAVDGEIPGGVLARLDEVFREFWLWVVAGIDRDGCHAADRERNPMPRRSVAAPPAPPASAAPPAPPAASVADELDLPVAARSLSTPPIPVDPRGLVELFVEQRLQRRSAGWVSRARVSREFGTFLRVTGRTFDAPRAVAYATFDGVLGERSRRGSTQGWRGWAFGGPAREVDRFDD